MKRWPIYAGSVAATAGVLAAFVMTARPRLQETASSLSPDGRLRAVLLDPRSPFQVDRNFMVRIDEAGGASRTVFRSPDESPRGIGHDRLLWSRHSTRLLLVGKRFWVRGAAKLADGECLYFLYDVPSGRIWCNSDVTGPAFGTAELAGYDFGEDLVLEPGDRSVRPVGP